MKPIYVISLRGDKKHMPTLLQVCEALAVQEHLAKIADEMSMFTKVPGVSEAIQGLKDFADPSLSSKWTNQESWLNDRSEEFEGLLTGWQGTNSPQPHWNDPEECLMKVSRIWPETVLVLDIDNGKKSEDDERIYFQNGRRHRVKPYTSYPEFDPEQMTAPNE